ncbi:hypothetical protein AB0K43_19640 [Kitasatospora sp. NPDC049258]|uniref:hypothetical protein n=1 Tax=Kitasatospora sp. NPDC049258 TaxID=3155394 RepID=UPI003418A3BF
MSRSFRFVPSLVGAATLALVACGAAVAGSAGVCAGPSAQVSVTADGADATTAPHTDPSGTPSPQAGSDSNGWW